MKKHKKLIVWGAKFDTGHTHAFIHAAIVRAAQAMGIETYWLDNRDNISPEFFNNALVITEQWLVFQNGASNRLPLNDTATYIIHYLGNKGPVEGNPGADMYLGRVGKLIDFRFACNWGIDGVEDKNYAYRFEPEKYTKLGNGVSYFEYGDDYSKIYTIWGTDLLPNEIRLEDRHTVTKNPHYTFFAGTIRPDNQDVFMGWSKACEEHKVPFVYNTPWNNPLTTEQIRQLVRESYMAPDFRPANHLSNGYISCRVLKNISYGALGITNNKAIYEYLNGDVAYHPNSYDLYGVAEKLRDNKDIILRQMINIRDNHTYVNRVNDFIEAAELA